MQWKDRVSDCSGRVGGGYGGKSIRKLLTINGFSMMLRATDSRRPPGVSARSILESVTTSFEEATSVEVFSAFSAMTGRSDLVEGAIPEQVEVMERCVGLSDHGKEKKKVASKGNPMGMIYRRLLRTSKGY